MIDWIKIKLMERSLKSNELSISDKLDIFQCIPEIKSSRLLPTLFDLLDSCIKLDDRDNEFEIRGFIDKLVKAIWKFGYIRCAQERLVELSFNTRNQTLLTSILSEYNLDNSILNEYNPDKMISLYLADLICKKYEDTKLMVLVCTFLTECIRIRSDIKYNIGDVLKNLIEITLENNNEQIRIAIIEIGEPVIIQFKSSIIDYISEKNCALLSRSFGIALSVDRDKAIEIALIQIEKCRTSLERIFLLDCLHRSGLTQKEIAQKYLWDVRHKKERQVIASWQLYLLRQSLEIAEITRILNEIEIPVEVEVILREIDLRLRGEISEGEEDDDDVILSNIRELPKWIFQDRYDPGADEDMSLIDHSWDLNDSATNWKKMNRFALAHKMYMAAIAVTPEFTPQYHSNIAHVYRELKMYYKALESYDTAIKWMKDDYKTLWGMGLTYKYMGQYDEAIKIFSRLIDVIKNSGLHLMKPRYIPNVYVELGDVYTALGQSSKAIEFFSLALDIDSMYDEARRKLDALL